MLDKRKIGDIKQMGACEPPYEFIIESEFEFKGKLKTQYASRSGASQKTRKI